MIKQLDIIFKKNGLYNSKYIYIYSDFIKFFEINKKNPKKAVISFLELFTKKGITCIIPAFSYTISGNFSLEKTRSKVGFLANFIMNNLKHERSEHPLFSYVSIGKNKKIVCNIGKAAFGKNSVHERLFKKGAFFLNFCRPLEKGNTLVHHIEQINNSNYRFDKKFYTKVFKNKKYVGSSYSAYLRKNVTNSKTAFTFRKALKYLNKSDYLKTAHIKKLEVNIYNYDLFYRDLVDLINQDPKIFIKD
tara:strand:- start:7687 stop:8427 length:741 start_codon:yes stop_codon:yes gene_type:complete